MININIKKTVFILSLFFIIVFVMEMFPRSLFPIKYREYVYSSAIEQNIDPYLIFAIIKAESGFDPNAVSRKDARGLMQITEKTANWGAVALKYSNFSQEDLFNPEVNINIGTWYVATLMKEFDHDINLVLAAYNGGSGNVKNWLKNKELGYSGETPEKIPFKETKRFVLKVKNYYRIYENIYRK